MGDFWNPATVPLYVWQCEDCDLVFLYPVPVPENLPDSGEWWSEERMRFRRRRWFKTRWEKLRYSVIGHRRERIIGATRRAVKSGRFLDVGCGLGELLVTARNNFDCVGLDPSPIAARAVRKLGFPMIESTFEDADIAPKSFDVVMMDSVIEHVLSPALVLRKVNSILRMNGVVVMNTPKFNGPAYRWHRAGWNGFRHGYHTFLFTGMTLGRYLEKTGFGVLRYPRRDRILDDILVLAGRKVSGDNEVNSDQ